MKRKTVSMPRELACRIMRRGARVRGPVVVPFDKRGKPKKNVFGLDEYQKTQKVPTENKIWEHRKTNQSGPDPLGAIEGKVLGRLSRDDIYE